MGRLKPRQEWHTRTRNGDVIKRYRAIKYANVARAALGTWPGAGEFTAGGERVLLTV